MCVCFCVGCGVFIRLCLVVYVGLYLCVYVYVCLCACLYAFMGVFMRVFMSALVCVFMCVCSRVCSRVRWCVCVIMLLFVYYFYLFMCVRARGCMQLSQGSCCATMFSYTHHTLVCLYSPLFLFSAVNKQELTSR